MTDHDMEALIERLSRATGPGFNLFMDAYEACFGIVDFTDNERMKHFHRFTNLLSAGAYLDAAMSLVTEDCICGVIANTPAFAEVQRRDVATRDFHCKATAATPALALTIAALKARRP